MNKSILVKLAILVMTASALSGCLWVPVDEGPRHGEYRERDHGDHHGEHQDRHDDHGDRR